MPYEFRLITPYGQYVQDALQEQATHTTAFFLALQTSNSIGDPNLTLVLIIQGSVNGFCQFGLQSLY